MHLISEMLRNSKVCVGRYVDAYFYILKLYTYMATNDQFCMYIAQIQIFSLAVRTNNYGLI